MSLVAAAVYALALFLPSLATGSGLDAQQVRTAAALLTAYFAVVAALQLIASVGLTLGQGWARGTATVVCIAWCLTCVGVLVALPVLNALWRRTPTAKLEP